MTKEEIIEEILNRAIEKIYPSKKELKKALLSKRKLRVYFGVDPTSPHLHLDHGTSLLILKRFQKLGHKVFLLVGDFTAQIGDPTGRISPRKQLSREEVLENLKNYKKQASKILDFESKKNPAKLIFNSKWWRKFSLEDFIELLKKFTVGQLIKRDLFKRRMKAKKEIFLHEFIYPLLHGYDSVALNVDVEVGGSDQIFNMLIGREMLKIFKKKEKFILAKKLLSHPKTGEILMSKSKGKYIALDEKPLDMYGKIMALPDEIIISGFEHWTEVPLKEIKEMKEDLKLKKVSPRVLKAALAKEVVSLYHGKKIAERTEKEFNRIFKEKKLPSKIREVKLEKKKIQILELLVKVGLCSSKSEAKRLILQGGVRVNKEVEREWRKMIEVKDRMIIQVGKRKFVRLKVSKK